MSRYIDAYAAKIDAEERGGTLWLTDGDVKEVKRFLDDQPTADVAPVRRAIWEDCGSVWDENDEYKCFRCSACLIPFYKKSRFCPHCGAIMIEEGKNRAFAENGTTR